MRLWETPVLIPNTMVKTLAADGTLLETARESRWLPDFKRGRSSVGRAPALQAGGQEFESLRLHRKIDRIYFALEITKISAMISIFIISVCQLNKTLLTTFDIYYKIYIVENKYGGVAQLGEHLPCTQGVRSSILLISTMFVL